MNKSSQSNPRKKLFYMAIAACLLIAFGTGIGYVLTKNYYHDLLSRIRPLFVPNSPYSLLHPIVGLSLPSDLFTGEFADLKAGVQKIIESTPSGVVDRYSFYFRDLNSSRWTGINERDTYDPASLLKVVVAITAYKQSEEKPQYLTTPLTYTSALASINNSVAFSQPAELQTGHSYLVPFLIDKELADSDNGAVNLLLDSLPDSALDQTYEGLSIPKPSTGDSAGYKLSPFEYARFFRILYNGTFDLEWKHSNAILESLSHSTYTSALRAGVPSDITVAHKYGEHVTGANGSITSVELSDCGIVYDKNHPYFLCVMTEGKKTEDLAKVIANISTYVYQSVLKEPK